MHDLPHWSQTPRHVGSLCHHARSPSLVPGGINVLFVPSCTISLTDPRRNVLFEQPLISLTGPRRNVLFVQPLISLTDPRHAACAAILCYPESIFQYCLTVLLIDNNNYVHWRTTTLKL